MSTDLHKKDGQCEGCPYILPSGYDRCPLCPEGSHKTAEERPCSCGKCLECDARNYHADLARRPLIERLQEAANRIGYQADNGCDYSLNDANAIGEAITAIRSLSGALKLARTFMVDFEGLPEWLADNPLKVVDAALASVGRHAERQDAEERLGPKDEHAVAAQPADAQPSPPDHPHERTV